MIDSKMKSAFAFCSGVLIACSSGGGNSNTASGGTTGTPGGTTGTSGGASAGGTVGSGGLANGGSTGLSAGTGGMNVGQGGAIAGGGGGAANTAGSPAGGMTNGGSANGGGANGGTANGGTAAGGAAGAGGTAAGGTGGNGAGGTAAFALTSSAFTEGMEIPLKYKCAEVPPVGMNISPPLSWGPGPAGTMSYAIILMHDPSPEHWVIWDIPSAVTSLPEDIEHAASPAMPAGAKQSTVNLDGFSGPGYLGPCPQAHNVAQTYIFTLYALDVATLPGLTATSTPAEAATVVKAHLVAGSQGVSLSGTQIQTP